MPYFAVRGFRFLLVAVLVAIAVGVGIEAGQVATGPKAAFRSALDTIGSSSAIEIGFRVNFPTRDEVAREVRSGTFELDLSSVNGQPLAGQESSALDEQLSISEGGVELAALRVDQEKAFYVRVNLAEIGAFPSLPRAEQSTLRSIGRLVGATWFEVPSSLISSIKDTAGNLAAPGPGAPVTTKIQATIQQWKGDILAVAHFSSKPVAGGSAVSAEIALSDLERITVHDFAPLASSFGASVGGAFAKGQQRASTATGKATVTVVDGRSGAMRSGQLTVAADRQQAPIAAAVTHAPVDLGPPPGALPVPPAIGEAITRVIGARLLA